jgi:hypothetical protein
MKLGGNTLHHVQHTPARESGKRYSALGRWTLALVIRHHQPGGAVDVDVEVTVGHSSTDNTARRYHT